MKWVFGPQHTDLLKIPNIAEYLCGNKLFKGSTPTAHNYCGHQFGYFSGQLGDGRAISIGDVKPYTESPSD